MITASTTSIRLYAQGTPSATGSNNYNFTAPGSPACSFAVNVISSVGNFVNPANRCTEILTANPSATDGYFWIKDASGNKFKTYCDMTNGGWTLVKSLSERQIIVVEQTQNESIASQSSRNIVTTETGIFNEYAFSLPGATVNNIGNTNNSNKLFRFSIKEKGQSTSAGNVQDAENSTVAPINDSWLNNNYLDVTITDGNPATGNYTTQGHTAVGKLFGFDFKKPNTGLTPFQINGVPFISWIYGMYSVSNSFTGIFGGVGYASANTSANNLTYNSSNGSSVTFNKYYINDLYGIYINSERELNHHIGTCSNSTDDYGGASFCNAGWANWRPHKFNQRPDGSYEGRIVQLLG